MKKMITLLLIAIMTITMTTMTAVSASAATGDTTEDMTITLNQISYIREAFGRVMVLDKDINTFSSKSRSCVFNPDNTWSYTDEEADYITVSFDELTYAHEDYYRILVLDKYDNLFNAYTGDALAGKSICVPGNKVTVKVVSNRIIPDETEDVVSNVNITSFAPLRLSIIDLNDANSTASLSAMQQYISGETDLTDTQIQLADLDGDGDLTVADITDFQRCFVDLM